MSLTLDGKRFQVPPSVQAIETDDCFVLLDAASGEYFALYDVGSLIWQRLIVGQEFDGIVDAVVATYDVDRAKAQTDAAAFLRSLVDRKLVRVC